MQPQSAQDYKNLLTEVIKKQIVILGPDITLSKARNVKGLTVQNDGTVTDVVGSPQEVTQALIDQFVQLSGLIVKKTMEPLLLGTQFSNPQPPTQTPPQSAQPPAANQQVVPPQSPAPSDSSAIPQQASPQPTQEATNPQATQMPPPALDQVQQTPLPQASGVPQPPQPSESPVQPASNPLAA